MRKTLSTSPHIVYLVKKRLKQEAQAHHQFQNCNHITFATVHNINTSAGKPHLRVLMKNIYDAHLIGQILSASEQSFIVLLHIPSFSK